MSIEHVFTAPTQAGASFTLEDSETLLFGTGGDSSIYFDGTNTYWDLQAVGTGGLTIDIGDGQAPDNGNVYIRKASSGYDFEDTGAISANSILNIENDGAAYFSFLVSASANAGLLVADGSGDVDAGRLWYNTANEDWEFYTGGTERMSLASTGLDMKNHDVLNVGAAGNDWTTDALTLSGSTSTQVITVVPTSGNAAAIVRIGLDASSTGDAALQFRQGSGNGSANNMQYTIRYEGDDNMLVLQSDDTDGGATNADIWRIADGGVAILYNGSHPTGTFDAFDDAMVLRDIYRPELPRPSMDALIAVGVAERHEDGFVGVDYAKMDALLAGGIYQTRQRVDELDERIAALEAK
jgi:hypothetical protein